MAEGKKQRKYDRNRAWCKAYAGGMKQEISHARRMAKHLVRQPWDRATWDRLRQMSPTALSRGGVKIPATVAPSPVQLRKDRGTTLTAERRSR